MQNKANAHVKNKSYLLKLPWEVFNFKELQSYKTWTTMLKVELQKMKDPIHMNKQMGLKS